MSQEQYDLVVIGAGPGGYVASVHAGKLGMKVACIDKNAELGGTCLNVGCIPSKALLDSSEYYHLACKKFQEHGIEVKEISFDLAKMMQRKRQVVANLNQQVHSLLQKHKVDIFTGTAKILSPHTIQITSSSQENKTIQGSKILLATGSEPIMPELFQHDGKLVVNSTEALSLEKVPQNLIVVGGGYIGLELGTVWLRLGAKVTIVEMLPQIATTLDNQIARQLERILRQQGMEFMLGSKVTGIRKQNDQVFVSVENNTQKTEHQADCVLVAIGRQPVTSNLGIEIQQKNSRIVVDENYRTSVPNIYAIGDIIEGPMLAHKASAEAISAIEGMANMTKEVDYDAVPSVIYTWPEVASVGLSQEQVIQRGIPYKVGTFPFAGVGRSICMGEKDGFVKVLAHQKSNRILGIHIIGPRASDMIAECALALHTQLSVEDLQHTIHAHPTFAEGIYEAVWNLRE